MRGYQLCFLPSYDIYSLIVQLFDLAGKGKRRRSSDEDATGEPKAKKPRYTDNKEVMWPPD
jgi:hypothetical protein